MHDVLEGVLQYEVELMLKHMIFVEQYFSLDFLNTRLENIELSCTEAKNRPTCISSITMSSGGNTLKQSGKWNLIIYTNYFVIYVASQMWLLGRILPIVIGEHVPDDDERWLLFLCLMDIVDLLFAPTISKDHAVYLSSLIKDHHCEFVQLYPDASVIPKFHFMVHMSRLMIKRAVTYNNASNVFTHL